VNEERTRGGTSALWVLTMVIVVGACGIIIYFVPAPQLVHTTNITIEHLWEENDEYYFSDEEGFVYRMRDGQAFGTQIMYDNLAKTRFEKLKEDGQYKVEYRCDWDVRISISEKEIER